MDDERENLDLIVRVLRRKYDVSTFTDPRAAVQAMSAGEPFGVLVTDVMMPGIDGIALARHARVLDSSIVVVVVSAYTETQEVLEAHKEGIVDVMLGKPWRPDEIRAAVDRAVLMGEMRTVESRRPRPPN